ncbi:MAG: hypothetical protein IJC93_03120 [Clostridia bacterium]|nr:hypothetical protein [Clostridia bacterium]
MKRSIKGVVLLMLMGILAGCGNTSPETITTSTTSPATVTTPVATEVPTDPGVFWPEYYYDFRTEATVYACTDFYHVSAESTESGMRLVFQGVNGSDYCFDPYFSLPSPTGSERFAIDQYRFAVVIANTSRADLPCILRYHTQTVSPQSYPSVYFTFDGTGRQKAILDLTDPNQVAAVVPTDFPLTGLCTDFRLDAYENEANTSDEFTLETIAFFRTKEEAERFTALPAPTALDAAPDTPAYDLTGKWLAEEFTNPPATYRARKLLYEFNNGFAFTVDSLRYMGYGGVVTNVPFNMEYLKNDADFELLDRAFAYAGESGMELWLYDEYQWPSGKAFGYVLDSDPTFEATGVEMLMFSGSGDIHYTLPENYLSIVGASLRTSDGMVPLPFTERAIQVENDGPYAIFLFARRYTYAADRTEDRSDFSTLRDVDLLNPDAVAKFIEITYEKYAQELDGTFADVTAVFTDEPNLGNRDYTNFVVWTDDLPETFYEMHGYDLTEHLCSLYFGQTELDRTVRVNFYQTVSELFSRAYTQQISAWCAEHGVSASGHLLFEELLKRQIETYGGDFMRIVSEMDIPGVDILHVEAENLLSPDTDVGSVIGLKYVSSAAKNAGKTDVMLEFTPLANPNALFRSDPARYAIEGATISTFCGANNFCVICPDSAFTVPALRTFNRYVGRINAVLDNATTVTPIGLFVPTDSARADHLVDAKREEKIDASLKSCAMTLLQNGLDFTFLDSRSLEQAELKDGILTIGLGRYSVIVLPETTVMSLAAAQKLADFESQGGLIVWTGSKPTITARFGESDALASIVADLGVKYTGLNVECLALLRSVAHPAINVAGGNTICISHYTRPDCGKEIFYLANLSDSAAAVTVSFPDNASFDVYIPMDGNIVSVSGSAELEIPPYEGVLVVR